MVCDTDEVCEWLDLSRIRCIYVIVTEDMVSITICTIYKNILISSFRLIELLIKTRIKSSILKNNLPPLNKLKPMTYQRENLLNNLANNNIS